MIDLAQEQTSHFITGAHHMLLSTTWSIKAHTGISIPSIPPVMQENSTVLRRVPAVTHQPNATGL